jgi:imidazolonepropionase-like amidohydrolase
MDTMTEEKIMNKAKVKSKKAKFMKSFLYLCLSVCICGLNSFAQSDGSQQNVIGKAGTFAIKGAKIVTVSGATIDNGTIIIKDGKIESLGATVAVPSGAEVIDGKGLSVYPGMIDSATNLGLAEITLSADPTVDVAEIGDMNANAKAIVGINPNTSHVNVTRVNGITTVLSMPSGGIVSGQSALINLWGATQADMAVVPTHSLVVNFPRITTFQGFGGGPQIEFSEAVRQRDRRLEALKKVFKEAEDYAFAKDAYEKDKTLPKPATNLKMEAMIDYVRGKKPIIFTAERERDIRGVAKFVEEMKLKGIIVGGQDAFKAADVLKKNNISVIFTNIYALPVQDDDAYDYLFAAPSKMAQAGIKFAISTGDYGAEVRDLPYHAGLASAYGLSKDDALKSVTLYPAQILGVDDKLGSLDVGKIANVVVTDGDMLQPTTNIKYLFINGRLLPLTSRHTELFEQYKDRK